MPIFYNRVRLVAVKGIGCGRIGDGELVLVAVGEVQAAQRIDQAELVQEV